MAFFLSKTVVPKGAALGLYLPMANAILAMTVLQPATRPKETLLVVALVVGGMIYSADMLCEPSGATAVEGTFQVIVLAAMLVSRVAFSRQHFPTFAQLTDEHGLKLSAMPVWRRRAFLSACLWGQFVRCGNTVCNHMKGLFIAGKDRHFRTSIGLWIVQCPYL